MGTKKTIRQGDDFKIVITFKDQSEAFLDAATQQFKFVYRDIYGNSYEVSYDGATRLNNYIDGDHLVGVFENYKLACCVLKREAWYGVDDPAFNDGKWNYGDTRLSAIELTEYGGAKEIEETIEVPDGICVNETLVISKGDKGDPFVYSDFTPDQLAALKGEAFLYEDFTLEQREALRGEKGDTPYIGATGRWLIGDIDTGVRAQGNDGVTFTPILNADGNLSWTNDGWRPNPPTQNIKGGKGDTGAEGKPGKNGIPGIPGAIGKSAYQYAVEGGYTGTEAQFKTEQAGIANNSTRLTVVEQHKQDKPIAGQTFLTPLFVARGAVFNQTTGYYELNGLTDITEAEMMDIYNGTNAAPGRYGNYTVSVKNIRTNYDVEVSMFFALDSAFKLCGKLEKVVITKPLQGKCDLAFYGCTKLQSVMLKDVRGVTSFSDTFMTCTSILDVVLSGLKVGISLKSSPLLARESILYLVNNAANTTPITVTLHPDALARLTEADIALASSKNITLTSV